MNTFFWYDYETFGTDTRRDRIAQFAGMRTDEQLEPVGEEVVLYCRIADDYLPDPCSCLVTGIVPQTTLREGVVEAQFASCVHDELAAPGTCGVGYNSIRFDDEFTRFLLYRNFYDAYAREWQNGNSRWDLIDALRLAHALRPDGIAWPLREDGTASFRLEDLTRANGLEHSEAHDALADVRATVAMARLLKACQPRLFDYVYRTRDRRSAAKLLDVRERRAVLHVSSKYPARTGCIALVAPVCYVDGSNREVVVFDLRQDPRVLWELSADEIAQRVFTPGEALAPEQERIGLKTVRLNRAPVLAPAATLSPQAAGRWSIDLAQSQRHLARIDEHGEEIEAKVAAAFRFPAHEVTEADPETALYDEFLSDADRALLPQIRSAETATAFAEVAARFRDPRLREMVFTYRARNAVHTLSAREQQQWLQRRRSRLLDGALGARSLAQFHAAIEEQQQRQDLTPAEQAVLSQLAAYAQSVSRTL